MYKSLFSSIKIESNSKNQDKNKIYFLLDKKNNLIKIGRSISLKIREKTLQGENPNWEMITAWIAPPEIESKLHETFSKKRIRGEWFILTYSDLVEINSYMKLFDQVKLK